MLVRPQLEYAGEVWIPYTMKCIKKIEQIQRNSSIMNTVETLTPLFSLTGQTLIPFIHVGSFNKQPSFTKFITTLLTYILHLTYNMQTISQAEYHIYTRMLQNYITIFRRLSSNSTEQKF